MPRRTKPASRRQRRTAAAKHWADYEHGTYIVRLDPTHFRIVCWDPTKVNSRTGKPGAQVDVRASARTPEQAEAKARARARELEARLAAGLTAVAVGTVCALAVDTKNDIAKRLAAGRISKRYADKVGGCIDSWVLHPDHGIGDVALKDWTPAVSEDLLDRARAVVSDARVQDIGQALRVVITRGQATKVLLKDASTDPLSGVRYTARSKTQDEEVGWVDRDQLPTLDDCIAQEEALGHILGDEWRIMLRLKREGFIRYGEWLALTPDDFDFETAANAGDVAAGRAATVGDLIPHREVRIHRAIEEPDSGPISVKPTKNESRRSTTFTAELTDELRRLVDEVRATRGGQARILQGATRVKAPSPKALKALGLRATSAFFDGGTISRKTFSRAWGRAAEAAGLPVETEVGSDGRRTRTCRWTAHDWRHWGACHWLFDRHADPGSVRYAGGWHSVAFMLSRYTSHRGSAIRHLTDLGAN